MAPERTGKRSVRFGKTSVVSMQWHVTRRAFAVDNQYTVHTHPQGWRQNPMHFLSLLAAVLLLMPSWAQASDYPNINLRVSPLTMVTGYWNLRADMGITERWLLGVQGESYNRTLQGIPKKSQAFGVMASYYHDGIFEDGPYVDLGFSISHQTASATGNGGQVYSVDFDNHGVRALAGYHWFWLPFNLNAGIGLASNSVGEVKIRDASGKEVSSVNYKPIGLALDFSIGWAF